MSDAKGTTAETLSPFDATDYLTDEETIAEDLAAMAECGDPAISTIAAANVAKARKRLQRRHVTVELVAKNVNRQRARRSKP